MGILTFLLHSCVEVSEPIEQSFGALRVVGPGIGVLDGGQHAARGREGFGKFIPLV